MKLLEYLGSFLVCENCRCCEMILPSEGCALSLCEKCWQQLRCSKPSLDWCATQQIPTTTSVAPELSAQAVFSKCLGLIDQAYYSLLRRFFRSSVRQPETTSSLPVPVASAFVYDGLVRELLHQMKYQDDPLIAVDFASLTLPALEALSTVFPVEDAILMPLPLSTWRFMGRGFNQAEILAVELGKLTGMRVRSSYLKRKHTTAQHELSREERIANLSGAFFLSRTAKLPKTVILVDDIYTSGATLFEAANLLRSAGVINVGAITVARAVLGQDALLRHSVNKRPRKRGELTSNAGSGTR